MRSYRCAKCGIKSWSNTHMSINDRGHYEFLCQPCSPYHARKVSHIEAEFKTFRELLGTINISLFDHRFVEVVDGEIACSCGALLPDDREFYLHQMFWLNNQLEKNSSNVRVK